DRTPPATASAIRLSLLGRCAMPSSPPANVSCEKAAAAPRLSSVVFNSWDCMARIGRSHSGLGNGDVVGDGTVGRERGDHRAVLLDREVDRAAHLHLVGPLAPDRDV